MENNEKIVKVWDIPVRVFHWSLVLLIGFSWLSGEMEWMTWHMWSGYAVLTLILFRIVWGFIGSRYARFASFIYGPAAVIRYLKSLPSRKAAVHAGHNPVGGLSVIALILCVGVQAATGLYANDDVLTEGPLYRFVTKELSDFLTTIHKYNFNVLLGLIGVHVSAVLFYFIYKSENLIRPMFTGKKRLPADFADADARYAPLLLALVTLGIAAATVYFIVKK
jgi:cytochrome b